MGGVRVAYLGPRGTFTDQALRGALVAGAFEALPRNGVRAAVMAVQEGAATHAIVPIENSIEGSVTATLDTLSGEAPDVEIVGELVLDIHHCLIAASDVPASRIEVVRSHPQAIAQCARYLRQHLPQARIRTAASTAEAVQMLGEEADVQSAALGSALAGELYDGVIIDADIEDRPDNRTRFVWLAARRREAPPLPLAQQPADRCARKTSIVFWGPGAEHAGWLVGCLQELASRGVNLTKIESRPSGERLGHYMFFADLQGACEEESLREALSALAGHCQQVRILGSYPAAA